MFHEKLSTVKLKGNSETGEEYFTWGKDSRSFFVWSLIQLLSFLHQEDKPRSCCANFLPTEASSIVLEWSSLHMTPRSNQGHLVRCGPRGSNWHATCSANTLRTFWTCASDQKLLGKLITLTTSWRDDLVEQFHAGFLPDFFDYSSEFFIGLLQVP